jgi:hypothetical protein
MGFAEAGLLSAGACAVFPLVEALLSSVLPQDWRQSVGGAAIVDVDLLAGVSVLDHRVVGAGLGVSNPLNGVAAGLPWLLGDDTEAGVCVTITGSLGAVGIALAGAVCGVVVRLLGYGGKAGMGACAAAAGTTGLGIDENVFDGAGTLVTGLGNGGEYVGCPPERTVASAGFFSLVGGTVVLAAGAIGVAWPLTRLLLGVAAAGAVVPVAGVGDVPSLLDCTTCTTRWGAAVA